MDNNDKVIAGVMNEIRNLQQDAENFRLKGQEMDTRADNLTKAVDMLLLLDKPKNMVSLTKLAAKLGFNIPTVCDLGVLEALGIPRAYEAPENMAKLTALLRTYQREVLKIFHNKKDANNVTFEYAPEGMKKLKLVGEIALTPLHTPMLFVHFVASEVEQPEA